MHHFLRFLFVTLLIFQLPLLSTGIKEAKKAYAQKQFQKAIKLFTEYSKENQSDGEPYMFMGYIYESQKDFPRSMAMFRRAVELKLNPKQRKTSYLKIILFYNYHQGWDIVAHYSNRFLKLDPDNKEVSRMRDRAIANKGHDPGTLTYARPEDLKAKQKKNSEERGKQQAEKLEWEKERAKSEVVIEKPARKSSEERNWELSLKFFKQEDYSKADKIMQELLERSPNNKNYLYKAGIAKLRLGDYEKAIKYFETSKKFTNEKDHKLLYYLNLNEGQANQKLGNTNAAIALFKKAYYYNSSPILLPVLAKLYYENSYFDEAIKTADQILKTDSDNLEANMYKSLSLIGGGKKKLGYKNLLEFTKKINRVYPDINTVPEKFHEGLLQTGIFYSNRIKYKLALKYLTAVSSTKSKSPKFIFSLSKVYFYSKNYDLAVLLLGKIPEITASNYLLAKYYAKENNSIKAKEYLAKAGNLKEIYWIKAKVDPYFQEMLKTQDFVTFVNSKGVIITPPTKIDLPSTNDIKMETNIPRIEPPATKPETVPTKEANPTQPTMDPTPHPNITPNPQNESPSKNNLN